MPPEPQLIAENATLRKQLAAQGLLIQQQKEAIKRIQGTKLSLVAGKFAAEVDPKAEGEKVRGFIEHPSAVFTKMLAVLQHYAKATDGKLARDFLTSIGR